MLDLDELRSFQRGMSKLEGTIFLRSLKERWPELVGRLIGACIKWAAIGALLHLGWSFVR